MKTALFNAEIFFFGYENGKSLLMKKKKTVQQPVIFFISSASCIILLVFHLLLEFKVFKFFVVVVAPHCFQCSCIDDGNFVNEKMRHIARGEIQCLIRSPWIDIKIDSFYSSKSKKSVPNINKTTSVIVLCGVGNGV